MISAADARQWDWNHVFDVSGKVKSVPTFFFHQRWNWSWWPDLSFFLLKISPASFVALMAPLEEFFMARWAAEVASLLLAVWVAALITAVLNLLGSKMGGSNLFSSKNLLSAIYPPKTVFRSLWHPQPTHTNSLKSAFSWSDKFSKASLPKSVVSFWRF